MTWHLLSCPLGLPIEITSTVTRQITVFIHKDICPIFSVCIFVCFWFFHPHSFVYFNVLSQTQTLFDPMFISVYNLFYTSMPVLALGIFEQDVNAKNSITYPKLYTPGLKNALFNKREFFRSAVHGFVTSCVLFFIPFGE